MAFLFLEIRSILKEFKIRHKKKWEIYIEQSEENCWCDTNLNASAFQKAYNVRKYLIKELTWFGIYIIYIPTNPGVTSCVLKVRLAKA